MTASNEAAANVAETGSRPKGPNGEILAAGTVVVRSGDTDPEVLLIHRGKYDDWSLPKGHVEAGESAADAAVRETFEETGLTVDLVRPLASMTYPVGERTKLVVYFVAHVTGGSLRVNSEVDEFAWVARSALASYVLVAPVVAHLTPTDVPAVE